MLPEKAREVTTAADLPDWLTGKPLSSCAAFANPARRCTQAAGI